MKYKIAVFGSAKEDIPKEICNLAEEIGKEIASRGHTLITGAAKGISTFAAKGAKEIGGNVIGISPTAYDSEKRDYEVDFEFIDEVIHTGEGYKGRNVISVGMCDGMISVRGGFGTLNEITIAEGEGKPIVALEGSGESSDMVRGIFDKLNPNYRYFSVAKSPKEAVSKIIKMIEEKNNSV